MMLLNYNNFIHQDCTNVNVLSSEVTVQRWDTFSKVLQRETKSKWFTKVYLKLNPRDFQLQIWKYKIITQCWLDTFIEGLQNPINETDVSLTFLEWWNIFDIDDFLVQEKLIQIWEFIEYSENFCNAQTFPGSMKNWTCDLYEKYNWLEWSNSLEWYLYPDTYAINPNTFTVKTLVKKMLSNFDTRVYKTLFSHADNTTIRENIILASIIEKEEKNTSEKPTVAWILKKRLEEWWMIGADITVCYPFRLTADQCKLSVTKYLYEVNDYNTRQKVWLPAWPIWNPSFETINATLNSKDTDYYYYLHDTQTGQIYYGKTNAEHDRNKRLYLR
jgi:UPF0755 protein